MSVHWNDYLGKYLAIFSRTLDARIDIRAADRLEGPWSDTLILVNTEHSTPGLWWTNHGLGHAEFARDGGRTEYLTYARNSGFFRNEIRLVEIRFR